MRSSRLASLFTAGLVDSFGLALGWTLLALRLQETRGMAALGAMGAATLLGVALSAPLTTWLTRRVSGRTLLRSTAGAEGCLRLITWLLLLANAPLPLLAASVMAMSVLAWTGYAAMRAEVAAADPSPEAITRYPAVITAVEAAAATVAALLPSWDAGSFLGVVVIGLYVASLLPTWLVARRATVVPVPRTHAAAVHRSPAWWLRLGAGAGVMLLAAGPTLLAIGLANDLHGRRGVAMSAAAFTAGALLAPSLVRRVVRHGMLSWPWLGACVLAGWPLASRGLFGLVLAQLLSGAALTLFEGVMDAPVATGGSAVTSGLAWNTAARALAGAAAVALMPGMVAAFTLPVLSGAGIAVLLAAGLMTVTVQRAHRIRRHALQDVLLTPG